MQFIVLCSSNGTTFQAVMDAVKNGQLTACCLGLITDKPDRGCIAKAKAADLPVQIVEKQSSESEECYDQRLVDAAHHLEQSASVDHDETIVAAMGWMRLLSPTFLSAYPGRVLNVHPSLLPKHGGKGMYGTHVHETVIAHGDSESGITIHVMNEHYDEGRVLLQKSCPIEKDETALTLKDRVQALEREWYPKVLEMIEQGEISL